MNIRFKKEVLSSNLMAWKESPSPTLSRKMDVILLNNDCVVYNKPLAESTTIFIYTIFGYKLILKFINEILPLIDHKINLIIGGTDYTFPNNTDIRMQDAVNRKIFGSEPFPEHELNKITSSPFINKIFVENLDADFHKAYPIPLGVDRSAPQLPDKPHLFVQIEYFQKFYNLNASKPLKFTYFNRVRRSPQFKERRDVLSLCQTTWSKHYHKSTLSKSHSEYLEIMGSCLFTICVHGGGLDVNPKLWEALLIGVIPIIKENKPYTDLYVELDLPVVIIKEWSATTITQENLTLWRNKYYNYFTDQEKRNKILEILSLDYWVRYVSTI